MRAATAGSVDDASPPRAFLLLRHQSLLRDDMTMICYALHALFHFSRCGMLEDTRFPLAFFEMSDAH